MTRLGRGLATLGGLGVALCFAAITWKFGVPVGIAVIAAAIGGAFLLLAPRAALVGFVGIVALGEAGPAAGLVNVSPLYERAGAVFTVAQLLLAGVLFAVALLAARPGVGFRLPGPFTMPLALLALATVLASVTGYYGGGSATDVLTPAFLLAPLVLLPILIVTAARRSGDGRRLVRVGVALAAARTILGLAAFAFVGQIDPGLGDRSTSYEPASNWLVVVLILGLSAALLRRIRLPGRLLVFLPLALAALTLSYRRSFWIAAVLGLVLVLVIASGQVGRRLIVPVVVVIGVGIFLALSSGVVGQLQGPVAARLESLNPSKVAANDQDRYRIGERKNVLAEIRDHPLTGLGLGVDWRGRYPVTISFTDQRNYVHMGLLWFWLKLGLLGAIAYLWIFGTAITTGLRVFRRHPDPVVGLGGLAVATGTLGLLVAELTASWVGPDARLTVVFAAALGALAVANGEVARRAAPAPVVAEPASAEERVTA